MPPRPKLVFTRPKNENSPLRIIENCCFCFWIFLCFSAKPLSRRSRLTRTSRAPSRLSRPRPIDCDRGIQLVQYSRQYTATHILFPRSFYIYICTSVENRTYKTRHYPPSDASPQRVRVTALAVALHDAPAGIAHFSSLSCPERNEACCGVPAGPAWRQCLAV